MENIKIKKLPKVFFTLANPINETNLFYEILYKSNDFWREHLLKNYPEFKSIKQKNISEIRKIIVKIYKENFENILNNLEEKQKAWEKINDRFFEALFEILDVGKFNKDIIANLTIVPIGMRFIKENRITIQYWLPKEEFLQICAHEIIHLIWFDKLTKEFPDINLELFDDEKSKEWILSEGICPIILNDNKIRKLIGDSSKESYACDKKIINIFIKIYQNKVLEKKSFREFYLELMAKLNK
ncbi:MAG: hypothetical protein ISS82_05560 [Nanoarchaeota archaeon]|nr:hypothetical protein [Nanoarchaeota archaeon]